MIKSGGLLLRDGGREALLLERTESLDVGAREIAAVQFVDPRVFYKLFVRTYDILSFL